MKCVHFRISSSYQFDGQEIVDISQKIGTFETSIEPNSRLLYDFLLQSILLQKPNLDLIKKSETNWKKKLMKCWKQAVKTAEIIR